MQMLLSNLCRKCRRVLNFYEFKQLSNNSTSIALENFHFLQKLGISKEKSLALICNNKRPCKLKLNKSVDALKKLGYNTDHIVTCPDVLLLRPVTMYHRYMGLQECGFYNEHLTLHLIYRFSYFTRKSIKDLKTSGLIKPDVDVMRNILGFSEMPKKLYPPQTDDSLPCRRVKEAALKIYLRWKLNLKKEEIEYKFKVDKPIRFKSIRVVMENYDFLTSDVPLSKKKIGQNIFVLNGHVDHYRELFECVPVVGTTPIRTMVKQLPKVLMSPTENLLETLKVLKEFKISDKAVDRYRNIVLLNSSTVSTRLHSLASDPYLRSMFHNPRICTMVCYYPRVHERNELLNELNQESRSLHGLAEYVKDFQSKMKNGTDHMKGVDIIHFLCKEMKMKAGPIRKILGNHRMWYCLPTPTITTTLQYLLDAGFQREHIARALPVVLFPKAEVEQCLQQLQTCSEVDCCRDENGQVRPELELQLVLYYLERPYHFTGNSIWGRRQPLAEAADSI